MLIEEKGYRDEELPHPRTFQRLLNRLNYRLRRAQKTKPLKKIPETEASFEHVAKANRESDEREDSLHISIDNLQHFISASPWSGEAVCRQVQDELKATPELVRGGVLLVDESAEEKASAKSAGAGRQYNGRMGKVEMSQVGVLLSYVNLKVAQGFWSWIDGRLFLPEAWFAAGQEALRKRLGIPRDLGFKTKVELAWEMIEAAITQGIPFEVVGFDTRLRAQRLVTRRGARCPSAL